ncbi:MAG: hypothetical protein V3W33_00890 [Gammaproteobacteria bacterium]
MLEGDEVRIKGNSTGLCHAYKPALQWRVPPALLERAGLAVLIFDRFE